MEAYGSVKIWHIKTFKRLILYEQKIPPHFSSPNSGNMGDTFKKGVANTYTFTMLRYLTMRQLKG